MSDPLILAIILILFLMLLLFALNFKIARGKEAHVVERLGQFYKIVNGPALFFNFPLLDRVVQVVPLEQQEMTIKFEEPDAKKQHTINLSYQISQIKLYVYASLDSTKSLKEYIQNNISFEHDSSDDITQQIHEHAKIYGIEILDCQFE